MVGPGPVRICMGDRARGRLQSTIRPVEVGPGVSIVGRKPRRIVTVKAGDERWRDKFARLVERLGLDVRLVQDFGWTAIYDVTGSPFAIEQCEQSSCVVSAHDALDCRGR